MEKRKLERLDSKIFNRLNETDAKRIHGGRILGTETACTYGGGKGDGDLHEC